VPAKPPGVYPQGTPGTYPLTISVAGGDCDSYVRAVPGDTAGGCPGSKISWYGPGTWVTFNADVALLGPSWLPQTTAFDHWEGPNGVQSRQNPIALQINGPGFVRGVFAFLGRVGG
jgi:hypothetical protein